MAVPQPRVPQPRREPQPKPQPEPEPKPDQEPEAKLPPPVDPREHSTVPKEREQQHSPADSSGSRDEDNAVGPDIIGRYGRVVALAEHLVTLKDLQGALTNQQVAVIIKLWQELSEYNRRPATFPRRHKDHLLQGCFKSPKGTSTVHGTDSVKKSFLGSNAAPASKPTLNRYMEALVSKLCELYPSPVKKGSTTILRFTRVIAT